MSPQEWARIQELLEVAIKLTPEERSRFFRDLRAANDPLWDKVQSLLKHEDAAASFLESGPGTNAGIEPEQPLTNQTTATILTAGSQLGPYRIEAPLGAGGMGQVYKARDTRLGRGVAIKITREEFASR